MEHFTQEEQIFDVFVTVANLSKQMETKAQMPSEFPQAVCNKSRENLYTKCIVKGNEVRINSDNLDDRTKIKDHNSVPLKEISKAL